MNPLVSTRGTAVIAEVVAAQHDIGGKLGLHFPFFPLGNFFCTKGHIRVLGICGVKRRSSCHNGSLSQAHAGRGRNMRVPSISINVMVIIPEPGRLMAFGPGG